MLYCSFLKTFLSLGHCCTLKKRLSERERRRLVLEKYYFLANEIFIALVCVILKPCSASRAAPACTSFSNSTKAMSWRPGTRRTSLNPGNLDSQKYSQALLLTNRQICITESRKRDLWLTGWRAWTAWARWSPRAGLWGRGCDWEDFLRPGRIKKVVSVE